LGGILFTVAVESSAGWLICAFRPLSGKQKLRQTLCGKKRDLNFGAGVTFRKTDALRPKENELMSVLDTNG
jgi:hypothetical protein